jgi:DNA polymerase III delta prime subunit
MATNDMQAAYNKFQLIKSIMKEAAEKEKNVLFRGDRGVGKTSMVKEVANELELELKTYSIATLDPFIDLVGIAVPDIQKQILTYFREQGLLNAEFLFFDEMNRGHRRITNAIFEIVQFKTLNGEPLPKLKIAWGAINPSDREHYHTEDTDIALLDRFHYLIDVPYQINPEYFEKKYNSDIAKTAFNWWNDLSDQSFENKPSLRAACSPRRLDYLVEGCLDGSSVEYLQPFDVILPIAILKKNLQRVSNPITLEDMIQNKQKYIDIAKNCNSSDEELNNVVSFLKTIEDPVDMLKVLDIVMSLKKTEYISTLIHRTEELNDVGVPCITFDKMKEVMSEKQGILAVTEFNKKFLEILH